MKPTRRCSWAEGWQRAAACKESQRVQVAPEDGFWGVKRGLSTLEGTWNFWEWCSASLSRGIPLLTCPRPNFQFVELLFLVFSFSVAGAERKGSTFKILGSESLGLAWLRGQESRSCAKAEA